MRHTTALLAALALCLSLCACSAGEPAVIPPESDGPLAGAEPTPEPSPALPSEEPSPEPSAETSAEPSEEPSAEPSMEPSEEPSADPAGSPAPTAKPSPTSVPMPTPSPAPAPTPVPVPTPSPAPAPTPELPPDPERTPPPTDLAPDAANGADLAAFYESVASGDENFGANMALTGEYLDQLYPGLTGIAAKQTFIYEPMISSVVCEIALVEVENSADVEAVKAIFQARIDAQVGDDDNPGLAWYPASIEGWQNDSRIVSNGNCVMLIAYDKCDDIVSAFNELFK